MPMRCFVQAAVCMALLARLVAAQEPVFMVPSRFTPAVGERVELTLQEPRGVDVAWIDEQVVWSLVRVAGTQENSDRSPRAGEGGPAGTVQLATRGAAVIGVDFQPKTAELDAAAIERLKASAGAKEGEARARREVSVRIVQSAKAIIRVGEVGPGQSPNATAKTGQQAEMRPTFDPTGIGIGSDIPLVVYAGDGKAPGAKLIATHTASGEKQEFTANETGVGVFRLSRAGVWRIEMRHLAAAKDPKEGEPAWVLYTATLTFEAASAKENGP